MKYQRCNTGKQFQIKCYYNVENWQKSCRKKTVIQLIVVMFVGVANKQTQTNKQRQKRNN